MYIFCVNIFSISRFSSNFASSWIPPGSTFSYLMEEVVMQQSPDESNTIKGILSL